MVMKKAQPIFLKAEEKEEATHILSHMQAYGVRG